jgi:hypothetical protein
MTDDHIVLASPRENFRSIICIFFPSIQTKGKNACDRPLDVFFYRSRTTGTAKQIQLPTLKDIHGQYLAVQATPYFFSFSLIVTI